MGILPHAERIEIATSLPPESVLQRLREVATNWRRLALAPRGLWAGAYAWIVEERAGEIVLSPRTYRGGIPFAIFVGQISTSPAGSTIRGVIRLHRAALVALVFFVTMAALIPIGALFEAVPREDWDQHVVRARTLALYSAIFIGVGMGMAGFIKRLLARDVRALLGAAIR